VGGDNAAPILGMLAGLAASFIVYAGVWLVIKRTGS
jgi:hypothetical protein